MKFRKQAHSNRSRVWKRLRAVFASAVLPLALSGCGLATHTHAVNRVTVIADVRNATLDQLLQQISGDYKFIQSMTATVDITATTGSEHNGEVKEYPTFAGYIVLRKPADLHIQMLVPVVRSRALEMVSDGKEFKLYIPPQNKAVTGKDQEPEKVSPNGLENLRPYIIRDALTMPPISADEEVALVDNSRIIPPGPGHPKMTLEEPDYDLTIVKHKQGQELELLRVIHIGRVTLQPYEQDIYDHAGHIATVVMYDKYQKFGDRVYPQVILIKRPLDEYSLKIEFSKIIFNQDVDDDSFLLNIPEGVPITKM